MAGESTSLEARAWIYVEPVLPFTFSKRVRYLTDSNQDKVMCKLDDLEFALKREHQFPRDIVADLHLKLSCGMATIVDLKTKELFRYDQEPVLLKQGVIRVANKGAKISDLTKESKNIQKLVNAELFKV